MMHPCDGDINKCCVLVTLETVYWEMVAQKDSAEGLIDEAEWDDFMQWIKDRMKELK